MQLLRITNNDANLKQRPPKSGGVMGVAF